MLDGAGSGGTWNTKQHWLYMFVPWASQIPDIAGLHSENTRIALEVSLCLLKQHPCHVYEALCYVRWLCSGIAAYAIGFRNPTNSRTTHFDDNEIWINPSLSRTLYAIRYSFSFSLSLSRSLSVSAMHSNRCARHWLYSNSSHCQSWS